VDKTGAARWYDRRIFDSFYILRIAYK